MPKSKVEKSLSKELPFVTGSHVGVDAKRRYNAMDQSIRVPQIGTSMGAGFGDKITDSDREWAAQREPVANRITCMVAADIFDNWFEIDDPRTAGKDTKLNEKFQTVLSKFNAKTIFTDAAIYERTLGYSLIVIGFSDAPTEANLGDKKRRGAKISQLEVYDKTDVSSVKKNTNPDSEEYDQPAVYTLNRGGGRQINVHQSRTIRLSTRLGEVSVLDPIWDDLTCLRNIRWGMAQTLYRYGSGFPVITIQGATTKQLRDWRDDPQIKDIMSRTYFLTNEKGTLKFEGAAGSALNPASYYNPIFENIAVGSGIPLAILRGAQAGELAGSEVNEREYFKVISSLQSKFEPFVRQLLDMLIESGQVDYEGDYVINWKPGFEPSEATRNQAQLLEEQANDLRLKYMSIDEVRAKMSLPALPNGEGAIVPGLVKPQQQLPFGGTQSFVSGASMDQAGQHPALVKMLKGIVDRTKKKEITREDAIAEATKLVEEFGKFEDQRALIWLRNRMKQPDIALTPELQAQLTNGRKRYMADFAAILDDALKAGELS